MPRVPSKQVPHQPLPPQVLQPAHPQPFLPLESVLRPERELQCLKPARACASVSLPKPTGESAWLANLSGGGGNFSTGVKVMGRREMWG